MRLNLKLLTLLLCLSKALFSLSAELSFTKTQSDREMAELGLRESIPPLKDVKTVYRYETIIPFIKISGIRVLKNETLTLRVVTGIKSENEKKDESLSFTNEYTLGPSEDTGLIEISFFSEATYYMEESDTNGKYILFTKITDTKNNEEIYKENEFRLKDYKAKEKIFDENSFLKWIMLFNEHNEIEEAISAFSFYGKNEARRKKNSVYKGKEANVSYDIFIGFFSKLFLEKPFLVSYLSKEYDNYAHINKSNMVVLLSTIEKQIKHINLPDYKNEYRKINEKIKNSPLADIHNDETIISDRAVKMYIGAFYASFEFRPIYKITQALALKDNARTLKRGKRGVERDKAKAIAYNAYRKAKDVLSLNYNFYPELKFYLYLIYKSEKTKRYIRKELENILLTDIKSFKEMEGGLER